MTSKTFMIAGAILSSVVGLGVPALEWMALSTGAADIAGPVRPASFPMPTVSSRDLERQWRVASMPDSASVVNPGARTPTRIRVATDSELSGLRDPFRMPSATALVSRLPPPIPLPVVTLTGLAGGGATGLAMMTIDGRSVMLAVGQSDQDVRLVKIVPPDLAEIEVRGCTQTVKLE